MGKSWPMGCVAWVLAIAAGVLAITVYHGQQSAALLNALGAGLAVGGTINLVGAWRATHDPLPGAGDAATLVGRGNRRGTRIDDEELAETSVSENREDG